MMTLSILWFIYKWSWISAFVLMFFRSDYQIIKEELLKGFIPNMSRGFFHILILSFILPITLPFTVANILNKWL